MAEQSGRCSRCGKAVESDPQSGPPPACPHCGQPFHPAVRAEPSGRVSAPPLVGQTLGEFQILEVLGTGGMGAVYKARQAALDRMVAVKVLPEELSSDPRRTERFLREARAAAAVKHPNIIDIYTVAEDRGYHYIAMELVEGQNLAEVLRHDGPLPADRAVQVLKQAASAVAKAHAAGVVHRDIKPSNILIAPDGVVKVADFGLAKRPDVDADVTQTGKALGTPQYMPPEVARGQPFDARGDLYSLGATFYHVLSGHPPFGGGTSAEVVAKLLETDPPPLRELVPGVPRALASLIHRLLEKDPARRCQSAEELLDALQEAQAAPSGSLGDLVDVLEHAESRPPAAAAPRAAPHARGRTASTPASRPSYLPGPRTPADIPLARKAEPNKALIAAVVGGVAVLIAIAVVLVSVIGREQPSPDTREPTVAERQPEPVDALNQPPTVRPTPKPEPQPPTPEPPKAEPPPKDDDRWTAWEDLFDGKTLGGWRVVDEKHFAQHGSVSVQDGRLVLEKGGRGTAIAWTGAFPSIDYEISLEAMRLDGPSTFSDLAFPLGAARCEMHTGAFDKGTVVGLTLVDGRDARTNGTGKDMGLVTGRWYRIRLRVTQGRIESWVDDRKAVDLATAGHTFAVWQWVEPIKPFGIAAFSAKAALRNIRLRRLKPAGAEASSAPASTRPAPRTRPATQVASAEEQRYAAALREWEGKIGAWDFRAAAAELAKLKFQDRALAERVAAQRGEAERLAKLKAKLIENLNQSQPWLRKGTAVVPGTGGKQFKATGQQVVKADEKGITVNVVTARSETPQEQAWASLDGQTVQKLLGLVLVDGSADDQLAAGILALGMKDAPSAEKHFEKAQGLGAQIDRYLGPLAAAAFAHARELLDKKQFAQAQAALADIEQRYARTPWWASHKAEFDAAQAQAKAAIADAEAEKLYAQAAKLHERKDLWELKPIVDKLKADYAKTRAVADASRKPAFADLAKAVESLGKFLTVRQDGKGDFRTIQAAIDAAPPNSLIEIQDNALYGEQVVLARHGLTLRGRQGCWPVVTSRGASSQVLLELGAPRAAVEHLLLVHTAPPADNSTCLMVRSAECRLRLTLACITGPQLRGLAAVRSGHGLSVEDSVVLGGRDIDQSARGVVLNNCLLLWGGDWTIVRTEARVRFCTIDNYVGYGDGCTIQDSIMRTLGQDGARDSKVERCDIHGQAAQLPTGCFSADPQFRDPANLDYRLKPTSPCRKKASDGGDIGCRYTPEMIEMLKVALELRKKGIIKF